MKLQERINAFAQLGSYLNTIVLNPLDEKFQTVLRTTKANNGWFIEENILHALKSWSKALQKDNLEKWVSNYQIPQDNIPKSIAIIMAGNIPLVGFHDFLSVLISGNRVLAKLSSNDKILLPFLTSEILKIEARFVDYITFTDEKLENFDAVIATGSNNTSTYFEYYFSKYPHIIRKNRNSVAVITGDETPEQMEALSEDIFRYFGLGCRNVSKIYVPEDYNWDHFFNNMFVQKQIINNHKYANNYDYNKAVYLMSNIKLLDNEFMLLKNDNGFSSPISVIFYEIYASNEKLRSQLVSEKENIQCVVSLKDIPFGEAQTPQLWDYADGVDTLSFLIAL
ncbi:acyl-CoA reductase [Patiriisocius marinistellae]|uniref:Acyl-CoA reductase n=1 Tax=Patiriisocius marinistellae TaxID=2494560 RepID=A0A5J4FYU7_9FLAO|nr:acyl-CoA reductase [Patiriisocius marinistellae]GEQ86324.1 acyl-CoA reductase [Patiriisocius marinistellae]